MKRRLLPGVLVLFFSFSCLAQEAPNLENGFKRYGSYDGSHLDTVNLMNGNLMLHIPLLPRYAERGNFGPEYFLYVTSKGWQIKCKPDSSSATGEDCWWTAAGAGVMAISGEGLLVRRTLLINNSGTGQILYNMQGYSLTGPDDSVHHFMALPGTPLAPTGDPTVYESIDGSGYHLVMSNPDTNGVMSTITILDRQGRQYTGTFDTQYVQGSGCGGRPNTLAIPQVGNYAPVIDDTPFGEESCPQYAYAQQATDANGNQMQFGADKITPPPLLTDTLGRSMPFTFTPATPGTADPAQCVTPANGTFYATDLIYYNAPDGSIQYFQRCYANMPIQTAFGVANVSEAPNTIGSVPGTVPLLVTLVQPDRTKWVFNYDSYANLTSVGLPTGGSISYDWTMIQLPSCYVDPTSISRAVKTRTFTDNNGHTTSWKYGWGQFSGGTLTNTVTDAAGNDTQHVFTALDGTAACAVYETTTKYYQGPASGTLLKQVDTQYPPLSSMIRDDSGHLGNIVPLKITTTVYPSGNVSQITKQYDTGYGPGTPIFGNVVQEREYDWGPGQGQPGPLLRETDTVYQWQKDGNYLNAHMVDLPASSIVISHDAAANTKTGCPLTASTSTSCMAETDYSYDEPITGYLLTPTPAITTQHVAPPAGVRGNQTTVSRWLSTTGEMVSSHTKWLDTGEPYQKIDPLGHTTNITYDSAYAGALPTQTCAPQTGTVTHCASGAYDFNTGALASLTDENGQTSNYAYDYMFHLTSAQAPPDPANGNARATTSFIYSDITAPGSFPVSITRTKPVTNALTDSATNTFDGLARLITSMHAMPSGPPSTVITTYDDVHAKVTATNPYFSTADATYGSTATQSDALGRPLTVTEQDGSLKSVSYDVVAPSSLGGDCTMATDEAGKSRRTCSDALGRLVEVDEPDSGAPASFASTTILISGAEQANPLPAASGTAYVDIGGSDGASQVCTDPLPPMLPKCSTVPDTGSIALQVGSYPGKSASFPSPNTTAAGLASDLAAQFHNDLSAPADAVVDPSIPTRVDLTARGSGAATNFALSVSPLQSQTADFYATASGSTFTGGRDSSSSPDTGSVTVSINGTLYSVNYGGTDSATTIAQRLAGVISAGTVASASASGGTITITAKTAGPGGNYSLTTSYTYDTAHFAHPSFTPSPVTGALSGGYNAGDFDNAPYVTLYSYDALGNLLCVEQHGDVAGTGCSAPPASDATSPWRVRRFTYDSLGRLLTAHNPESGLITYSYDGDGNLLQKTSPAPNQTGTATQTISYCYDELNRVTGTAYSAQSCPLLSPAVTYTYDSGVNAIGHLTGVTDQAGSASYSYDTLGRLASETRVLNGISKSLSYEYNLDGSLAALHYPSGAVVTYTPDSAGRFTSVVDSANGISYVTSAAYQADSQMTGFVSGNGAAFAGITSAFSYNKRLQPVNMSAIAPSQTVFSIGYDFHVGNGTTGSDNGDVWSIYNYRDRTRDQSFNYDTLNRLISAQNAGTDCTASTVNGKTEYWGNTYGYDPWGNLIDKTITKCGAETFHPGAASVQNQLTGYGYDAAGNMTSDPTDSVSSTYDAENRIATASTPQGLFTYTYDADGNRVEKSGGGTGTLYWYMTPGIIGESDLSGVMKSEYVFFNGERVARRDFDPTTGTPTGVFYYFSDHLKAASIVTDSVGNIKSESDYYPWGGELQFVNNDSNHYKFTGKERDTETGLDYFGARYYSNGLGRFITPDEPGLDQYRINPQSWNLYTYGRNNPLVYVDPTGNYVCGSSMSKGQCNSFGNSLSDAQKSADNLKQQYGADSTQYTDAQRAIDAYGKAGVNNGVTIQVGNVKGGDGSTEISNTTGAKTADNPTGQKQTVTFTAGGLKDAGLVGHEGSHVADGTAWVKSGFSLALNPTNFATEGRAFRVQAWLYAGAGAPWADVAIGNKSYPILPNGEHTPAGVRFAVNRFLEVPKNQGGYGLTWKDKTRAFPEPKRPQ